MTKASTPTEKSEKQPDNTKRHQNLDYITIADRLKTLGLSIVSHPTGVVTLVYRIQTNSEGPITIRRTPLSSKETIKVFGIDAVFA